MHAFLRTAQREARVALMCRGGAGAGTGSVARGVALQALWARVLCVAQACLGCPGEDSVERRLRADADDATRLVVSRPHLAQTLCTLADALQHHADTLLGSSSSEHVKEANLVLKEEPADSSEDTALLLVGALAVARWTRANAARLARSRASTREASLPAAVRRRLVQAATSLAALNSFAQQPAERALRRAVRSECAALVASPLGLELFFEGANERARFANECLENAALESSISSGSARELAACCCASLAQRPQLVAELVPAFIRPRALDAAFFDAIAQRLETPRYVGFEHVLGRLRAPGCWRLVSGLSLSLSRGVTT